MQFFSKLFFTFVKFFINFKCRYNWTLHHVRNSFSHSIERVSRARCRINSEIPSSALAASVRKHGQERRYLATATPPREMQVECNVKRKEGTAHARARTPSDLSPWSRDFSLVHSLVQTRFLMARPLLETRKSQISILDARTAVHYQRYTLCLHFNAPSRFVLRWIKA